MTFDPFAPTPENDKSQEKKNVYGDLLNTDGNPEVDKKPKFDPNYTGPQWNEAPTSAPSKPASAPNPESRPVSAPEPKPVSAPVPESSAAKEQDSTDSDGADNVDPKDHKVLRSKADRQRSVAERSSLPSITQRVSDARNPKKFRLLIAAIVVSFLVIGGGAGYGVYYAFSNKSDSQQIQNNILSKATVPGLSDDLTASKILAAARVEKVEPILNKEAEALSQEISGYGTYKTTPGISTQLLTPDGTKLPLYVASSKTYGTDAKLTNDQKQSIIDTVNKYAVPKGYTKFELASGITLDSPQIVVSGAKTAKDGSLESYNVIINTAAPATSNSTSVSTSGIYISFYSSPHIKTGDDAKFTKYIVDSSDTAK